MSSFVRLVVPMALAAVLLAGCAPSNDSVVGAPAVATTTAVPCAPGAVEVGPDADDLQRALDTARPGAVLQLSPVVYSGRFHAQVPGTDDAPVVLCGVEGSVLDGGDLGSGYTLHLDGASHWVVRDLTVRGGQKGVVLDAVSGATLSGVRIADVGQEGLHLRSGSSDNLVRAVSVSRTGLSDPEFGEGVYIGSAESNWCRYTACGPDRSDRNVFESLSVADTRAEAVDVKEGTSDGVIRSSTLSIAPDAVVDSAIDLKGSGWRVESSTVTGPAEAVSIHVILAPWGSGNTVSGSVLRAATGGRGVHLVGAAASADNLVACDNTVVEGTALGVDGC